MRTIDRYLLRNFIASLVLSLTAIIIIALIIDLVENLEDIVDNAASVKDVFLYYIYFIPWIYKIVVPASVFLAGLFSIGLLAKNREILAMKSAGISLYRIALPLLAFTLLLSAANFYFNEYLLPEATRERNRIKQGEIQKRQNVSETIMYNISSQGQGGYIYHLGSFRPGRNEAKDVLVQRFEGDSLRESYRGERMRYASGYWIMYDGAYRNFSDGTEHFMKFDSIVLENCKKPPREFERFRGKPEDMGYDELHDYIRMQRRSARPYVHELVDLRTKISFPFTSFIVMFISIPLASNPKRSGVAMSFAIASAVSLLYFVIFKVTQSLGYNGTLPPYAAAWSINVLFFLVGLIVFWRAHK